MQRYSVTESTFPLKLWQEPQEIALHEANATLPAPRSPQDLAAHYDLTISRPSTDMVSFRAFDGWLATAAASRGLSCCLIHDGVVRQALERLQNGRMTIGFHLDYFALWHVPGDPYARLAEAVADSGGTTVNPPAKSRFFTNKANAHKRLERDGLGVPPTLILPPASATLDETALKECSLSLAAQPTLYVKPANGFGSYGVVRVDKCTPDRLWAAVTESRRRHPGDSILLQREVPCPRLRSEDGAERWAYWRIVYCMGELIPFWWHREEVEHGRPSYRRVSGAEVNRLHLGGVLAYARDLAKLCGLNWFSTELCASEGSELSGYRVPGPDGRLLPLVAIDYVNDQCDVDVQSRWLGGPPDAFVCHAATRFAEAARGRQSCLPFPALPAAALRAA